MGDRTAEGRRGERAAARHLTRRGWTVLASRWRGGGGELDLVAARGDVVAICEVKARGDPTVLAEPVTAAQRARIARAAEAYLAARPELAGRVVRLDLIAVRLSRLRARVVHHPGAIDAIGRAR
jgi:putative endonuclease